jgi:hypothetical protein
MRSLTTVPPPAVTLDKSHETPGAPYSLKVHQLELGSVAFEPSGATISKPMASVGVAAG